MSFTQYLFDKRFFLCLYAIIMSFVSLVMFFGSQHNILYTNFGCFCFIVTYLIIGYYQRNNFYKKLCETVDFSVLPNPQTNEQTIYYTLLKKLHDEHLEQLQIFYDEKSEHQDFIMSWIHEIKLPISASRLLIENSNSKTIDYIVDKFEDELDKIDHYVEQALYYSRIDSFAKDYFIDELSLEKVVKHSIKKYAKMFITKRIRIKMDNSDTFVHSDFKWMSFIIDQIITNSLKYTDENGEIIIVIEEDIKEKRLLIQDTGIGIKTEDINRVFEKGFTGSTGRSHAKSTGMGLYLAKQLALKLGITLSIASEEGKYTKVVVHFPNIRNYYPS